MTEAQKYEKSLKELYFMTPAKLEKELAKQKIKATKLAEKGDILAAVWLANFPA